MRFEFIRHLVRKITTNCSICNTLTDNLLDYLIGKKRGLKFYLQPSHSSFDPRLLSINFIGKLFRFLHLTAKCFAFETGGAKWQSRS
jgi:hypothetical protein